MGPPAHAFSDEEGRAIEQLRVLHGVYLHQHSRQTLMPFNLDVVIKRKLSTGTYSHCYLIFILTVLRHLLPCCNPQQRAAHRTFITNATDPR